MTRIPSRVRPREITDLLAWARELTHAGPGSDPAEQTAFQAAKADLLARIADDRPDTAEQEQR